MEVKGPSTVWLLKYLRVFSRRKTQANDGKMFFLSENPLMLLKFGFLYAKIFFCFGVKHVFGRPLDIHTLI